MNEPGAKHSRRGSIGFDGTRRAPFASRSGCLRQGRYPAADIGFSDLADQKQVAFSKQIALQMTQSPDTIERFRTMSGLVVSLQIGLDCCFDGQAVASPR